MRVLTMSVLILPGCRPQRMMRHPSTINKLSKGENP
jgi:hypothetical protein